jgi:hypothetical protein
MQSKFVEQFLKQSTQINACTRISLCLHFIYVVSAVHNYERFSLGNKIFDMRFLFEQAGYAN